MPGGGHTQGDKDDSSYHVTGLINRALGAQCVIEVDSIRTK